MTTLSSKAIAEQQRSQAADIAARGSACSLRVVSLPGMTPSVFQEACARARVAARVRHVQGHEVVIWPKAADVNGAAWERVYREACALLGTTPADQRQRDDSALSPFLDRWRRTRFDATAGRSYPKHSTGFDTAPFWRVSSS